MFENRYEIDINSYKQKQRNKLKNERKRRSERARWPPLWKKKRKTKVHMFKVQEKYHISSRSEEEVVPIGVISTLFLRDIGRELPGFSFSI